MNKFSDMDNRGSADEDTREGVGRIGNDVDASSVSKRFLTGCEEFVRHNSMSDKFEMRRFHHVEFYTSDATNASRRFICGLGMDLVAKSDISTGEQLCFPVSIRS
jgi:hypothetical protein